MTRPDLHMHSTFSDGVLRPEQLVESCVEAGVTVMAVTDHDTFEGSARLLGHPLSLPLIPGVELSMEDMRGLHLLGYGTVRAPALRQKVKDLASARAERADKMLRRLDELGMPIDRELLLQRCTGTVGRPHIARMMVHHGYCQSMQEAFDRYLGHGKPAYVASERLKIRDAIRLLRENGFVPVLAHPAELQLELPVLEPVVRGWKDAGLLGLEVYHPSGAAVGYEQLDRMARRNGLLVTGGSDFHQMNDKHGRIGSTCDAWLRADEDLAALTEALDEGHRVCPDDPIS